jgi:hypothetical protein
MALKTGRSNWVATGFSAGAISRSARKTIDATVGAVASWVGGAIYVYHLAVAAVSAALATTARQARLVRSATAGSAASLARAIRVSWLYVSAGLLVFRKAVSTSWLARSIGLGEWRTPLEQVGRLIARFLLKAVAMASANRAGAIDGDFGLRQVLGADSDTAALLLARAEAGVSLSATFRLTVVPGTPDEGKNR